MACAIMDISQYIKWNKLGGGACDALTKEKGGANQSSQLEWIYIYRTGGGGGWSSKKVGGAYRGGGG